MAANSFVDPVISIKYWSSVEASNDGVLDGISVIHDTDVLGSRDFLTRLKSIVNGSKTGNGNIDTKLTVCSDEDYLFETALDCGAGVGRVTKGLLSLVCRTVDAVEPVKSLTKVMREDANFVDMRASGRLGRIWHCGLESWPPRSISESGNDENSVPSQTPIDMWRSEGDIKAGSGEVKIVTGVEDRQYDVIWIQWCIPYINDSQVLDLFARITGTGAFSSSPPLLSPHGCIVLKENIMTPDRNTRLRMGTDPLDLATDFYHPEDSSVTRGRSKFKMLFDRAGLEVVLEQQQEGLLKGLMPVWMWALRLRPVGKEKRNGRKIR